MAAGAASGSSLADKVAGWRSSAGPRRSRRDLVAFFEFATARGEDARVRMLAAAHQRALFSFVQHPVHARVVVILPVDHSKSFAMLTYALFLLAQDTNRRGLILSKTQHQAQKLVNLMRQIIDEEPRLRLVNPRMRRSARQGDPWSDTRFIRERTTSGPRTRASWPRGSRPGSREVASTSAWRTTSWTSTTPGRRSVASPPRRSSTPSCRPGWSRTAGSSSPTRCSTPRTSSP